MGGKFKNQKSIKKNNGQASRKELRKQMRKEKKARKNDYFRNKKNGKVKKEFDSNSRKTQLDPHKIGFKPIKESNRIKVVSNNLDNQECKTVSKTTEKSFIDIQNKLHKKEMREKSILERKMKNVRKKMLLEANEEEDKEIKRLEKQLKLNKRKTKSLPKSFVDEGLDWVLEVCDTEKIQESGNIPLNLQESGSEFEDDFAVVTGTGKRKLRGLQESNSIKRKKIHSSKDNDTNGSLSDNESLSDMSQYESENEDICESMNEQENYDSDNMSSNECEDSVNENEEDESVEEEKDVSDVEEDDYESDISERENDSLSRNSDSENEKGTGIEKNSLEAFDGSENLLKKKNKNEDLNRGVWEDIYGRLRDNKGNVIQAPEKGKYIPPQLRAKQFGLDSKKAEELARLKKQLKGLVNRLAESNLHSIANQIDELYMRNSRNDMNDSLLSLISEAVVAHVLTPERLVIEHAALIAVLHANVGLEVGAHFLQSYVQRFHSVFSLSPDVEDKELDNILLIISHLYNFKVFHAVLMYDLLDRLMERFTEKEVELILLVLRSVGFSLRKDDPLALKNLVLKLQKKANESDHLKDNPRVKFMLDVLLAVKNNNMTKIPQYDPSHSEHMKKLMKTMIHKGKYITELKITLEDLLKAEERGRWWIVGSAWAGTSNEKSSTTPVSAPALDSQYSQTVLDLARKQRMNTDTRRNIFCILVSAEDYLDAFEKLLRLALKGQQEQEIIHVLVHCLMQEKTYNPYYAHLATHFCTADRKHQMTIQYHVWDKLKELSKLSQNKISNLAKFLAHLFLEKALPISILKVMQFSEMDKCHVRLLRQVLLSVLLNDSVETMASVFSRVARPEKLHMFRESLRLFLHHFVLRNASDLAPDQANMLQERVKLVENALTTVDKAKFL